MVLRMYLVYNTVVRLCQFFVVAGKFYYDRKKKVPVVCLAGCAVVSVFECIEFECNKFVLVLAIIDLIYLLHSICISST